jgi:hypothetical protein
VEPVRSLFHRLAKGALFGVVVGLVVSAGLAALSILHTEGLLGNLVAAGTAATCFLLAARSQSMLEAVSRAIFGVVAGGALHAVGARFVEADTPRALFGIEAGTPLFDVPFFYAPIVGALAAALIVALPPRNAP